MKRLTLAMTFLAIVCACSPTSPGDIDRDRAIEIAREHVPFTPSTTEAATGTVDGQRAWIVTFRLDDGSHGGLGQFMEVTLNRATGRVITISRS